MQDRQGIGSGWISGVQLERRQRRATEICGNGELGVLRKIRGFGYPASARTAILRAAPLAFLCQLILVIALASRILVEAEFLRIAAGLAANLGIVLFVVLPVAAREGRIVEFAFVLGGAVVRAWLGIGHVAPPRLVRHAVDLGVDRAALARDLRV